jgi:3-oxoacyl-[acyl-carrier-protein] synthase II
VHTPPLRQRKRLVLSGYGLQLPGGDTRANWLSRVTSGATTIALDESNVCWVARIAPMLLEGKLRPFARSSPMIKFTLKAVGDLVDSSGLANTLANKPLSTGLVGGVTYSAHRALEKFMESVFVDGAAFASATQFPMTTMNATAGQVSIAYGIKGYNTTFCGSAAAFHYAAQLVEFGYQERMIVFGADELTPDLISLGCHMQLQATGAPGAWRSGYVFAEGAVALLLEEDEIARTAGREILAAVAGHALVQDGGGHDMAVDGDGMARAIREALVLANLDAKDVSSICLAVENDAQRAQTQMHTLSSVFGENTPTQLDPSQIYGHATAALLPLLLSLGGEAVRGRVTETIKDKSCLVIHSSLSGDHFAAVLVAP